MFSTSIGIHFLTFRNLGNKPFTNLFTFFALSEFNSISIDVYLALIGPVTIVTSVDMFVKFPS